MRNTFFQAVHVVHATFDEATAEVHLLEDDSVEPTLKQLTMMVEEVEELVVPNS